MSMSSYEALLREYEEHLEEKKGAAAATALSIAAGLGAASGAAYQAGAADGKANQGTTGEHVFGAGDWFGSSKDEPKPQAVKPVTLDLQGTYLALTMWGEARSEGGSGMNAVGHVIMNRIASPRWGDNIQSVVKHRKAFSCWNPGDPNVRAMQRMWQLDQKISKMAPNSDEWNAAMADLRKDGAYEEYKIYQDAKKIAQRIVSGNSSDPTKGSLFYHTTGVDPNWNNGQPVTARIGSHLFYRTDAKAPDKA